MLSLTILAGSCATILSGKKNTINIKHGTPEKALIYLDGEFLGEAPLKMRISKYKLQHGSMLEIKKEGYQTQRFEVVRSPHTWYVVADILTGVLPLIIDTANGNIYRTNTRNIEYILVPSNQLNQGKE
jgi:hypothetical protein